MIQDIAIYMSRLVLTMETNLQSTISIVVHGVICIRRISTGNAMQKGLRWQFCCFQSRRLDWFYIHMYLRNCSKRRLCPLGDVVILVSLRLSPDWTTLPSLADHVSAVSGRWVVLALRLSENVITQGLTISFHASSRAKRLCTELNPPIIFVLDALQQSQLRPTSLYLSRYLISADATIVKEL